MSQILNPEIFECVKTRFKDDEAAHIEFFDGGGNRFAVIATTIVNELNKNSIKYYGTREFNREKLENIIDEIIHHQKNDGFLILGPCQSRMDSAAWRDKIRYMILQHLKDSLEYLSNKADQ